MTTPPWAVRLCKVVADEIPDDSDRGDWDRAAAALAADEPMRRLLDACNMVARCVDGDTCDQKNEILIELEAALDQFHGEQKGAEK